ncbi:Protein FAR1-RELATED SEQUENCE 7, partial [Mucuna pruriens]
MVLDYEYFGFNHYKDSMIFGATLLYDETTESFKWPFEIFLEAHSKKRPQIIFINQDQAMDKALEVIPKTHHDFKKCMYEFDINVRFEEVQTKLIANFNVQENNWI